MIPRLQIPRMKSEGITQKKDLLPPITEAKGAAMLKLYCLETQGGMSVRGRLEQCANGMQLAPKDVLELPRSSTFCN